MYRKDNQSWIKHLDFLILDLVVLQLAFALAAVTRNGISFLYRNTPYRTLYVSISLMLALAELIFSILSENHKDILRRGYFKEFISVLKLVSVSALSILVFLFFAQTSENFSRLVILYFFLYAGALLYMERLFWKRAVLNHARHKTDRNHLLLVASESMAKEAVERVQEKGFANYEVIGLVIADRESIPGQGKTPDREESIGGVPVVTDSRHIIEYIRNNWVDEVMICLPREVQPSEKLLDELALMGIATHLVLNFETDRHVEQTVENVAGYLCLTESIHNASTGQLFVKRLMDIVGSLIGLAVTAVLFLFVAPAIWITDPGPVFFSQMRIGRNGRPFRIYKFRSMYQDAEKRKADYLEKNNIGSGLMFKMDNDPRILGSGSDGTRHGIGWFIRKTSIDEFPQFWNVLKGDLSLVGTRPPLKEEVEKYELHHYARLAIKPGITGMWQVSGRSRITDFEKVVALDLEYIRTWSIGLDIRILLKTIQVIFTGEGAE